MKRGRISELSAKNQSEIFDLFNLSMPPKINSLQKSNDELKKQLEEARQDLKKLEQRISDQERSRSESVSGAAFSLNEEAERSLEFIGQEYDNTKLELGRIGKTLSNIAGRLDVMEKIVEELQEYSYAFNIKLLGVPEKNVSESADDTSELCVKLFNAMGATVSLNDIDIAHRVPLRDSTRGGPKPIVCKFTRRLARNKVMAVRTEVSSVCARDIGLNDEIWLSNVRLVDHLTPKTQKLFIDAKAFKERYQYSFCWAKNGSVLLRKSADSRPLKVKNAGHLAELVQYELSHR